MYNFLQLVQGAARAAPAGAQHAASGRPPRADVSSCRAHRHVPLRDWRGTAGHALPPRSRATPRSGAWLAGHCGPCTASAFTRRSAFRCVIGGALRVKLRLRVHAPLRVQVRDSRGTAGRAPPPRSRATPRSGAWLAGHCGPSTAAAFTRHSAFRCVIGGTLRAKHRRRVHAPLRVQVRDWRDTADQAPPPRSRATPRSRAWFVE